MTDISLRYDSDQGIADIAQDGAGLLLGDELETAVIISLFTWRRALPDDRLPVEDNRRYGWWGDAYLPEQNDRIGSRLWLLLREKITTETLNRAREYCSEALQWMLDDGVAQDVDVLVERYGINEVAIQVTITRSDGRQVELRYDDVWNQLNA